MGRTCRWRPTGRICILAFAVFSSYRRIYQREHAQGAWRWPPVRADRFRFERDRIRFIGAHAAKRTILSCYLNLRPGELVFVHGKGGKPELASPLNASGLTFNLSHSQARALLAVSANSRIGADIEYIDRDFASEEIAERFFSPREANRLRALPAEECTAAFLNCWTRKEAYIKAIGSGLSLPLDSFDVAFGPDILPSLISARVSSPSERVTWRMYDIPVPQDYLSCCRNS